MHHNPYILPTAQHMNFILISWQHYARSVQCPTRRPCKIADVSLNRILLGNALKPTFSHFWPIAATHSCCLLKRSIGSGHCTKTSFVADSLQPPFDLLYINAIYTN